MIIGNIKNISAYKGLNERIDKAVDFVLNAPADIARGQARN